MYTLVWCKLLFLRIKKSRQEILGFPALYFASLNFSAPYTKVSFAAKADISRPTLDKLLNGNIDNKCTFDRHLQKILKMLNMSVEELMFYHSTSAKNINTAVFSQNTPENHKMSDLAKKQYDLLLDVIDLCAIYY